MGTPQGPYSGSSSEDLVLRDYLAAQRTVLANERTVLAYLRTTFALFIGGASLVQFFDHLATQVVGYAFIPIAIVVTAVALRKYFAMRKLLAEIGSPPPKLPREPTR